MKHLVLIASLLQGAFACFPTRQNQYQYGAPTQQFAAAPQQPYAPQQPVVSAARVAAAGKAPTSAIRTEGSAIESIFGRDVKLDPFTVEGYNREQGGPVNSGTGLTCNFDGRPCCWANVPPPEDQLDWQIATGSPNASIFRNAPVVQGSYLVAYARGAAPSDEAQFSSCAVGCSSSPITVRAKHWQTGTVLLQVCLRDSFPNNVEHNPLLHCQELPLPQGANGLTTTEVVLPKASLVDIIFVASNFVGENGDMVILDDIEVSYDHAGPECQSQDEDELQETSASHKQTIETSNHQEAVLPDKASETEGIEKVEKIEGGEGHHQEGEGHLLSAKDRFGESGFQGGSKAFGSGGGKKGFKATESLGVNGGIDESILIASEKTAKKSGPIAKGAKTKKFSETICQSTKCDFENGNTCEYKDAHQEQSIRGMTTKFQVVDGQFMNRVTGVKESSEGDFYAATFLFPREKAGLEAATEPFTEKTRMRFRYYEGTHGVQLKGCCGTVENCPFSSDKFVSVSDRTWKTASFKCPKGTDKVIFLCENTRTNQGACAVDDIGMVESEGSLKTVRPLC